jgi:UDP-N-acetylmuramoyl-tripeptide--D-alanyl-D-alanine ligase
MLRQKLLRRNHRATIFSFGIKKRADFSADNISSRGDKTEFFAAREKFSLNNLGQHNIYNALAAIAVGRIFGLGCQQISMALAGFAFPGGRFTLVRAKGLTFIDDTYNSNPASLQEALEALFSLKPQARRILVMGDMCELGRNEKGFHRQAGRHISGICDVFLGVGRLVKLAADSARETGLSSKNIFTCADSLQARKILFQRINPGKNDIILVKGSRKMRMEEVLRF